MGQHSKNLHGIIHTIKNHIEKLTISKRMLPSFLIIGCMKGGTTSLYNYLCQHPSIVPAQKKEIHFFDLNVSKGIDWYRQYFPPISHASNKNIITGEATPSYLFHPEAARNTARLLPHTKIIILLRNPVTRAWSHYHHAVRRGHDCLPFMEAVAYEQDRVQNGGFRWHSYLSRGLYRPQLERWLEVFPRNQILILETEEFFQNPSMVTNRVFQFLDLPQYHHLDLSHHNTGTYQPLNDTDRADLQAFFEPYNRALVQYLHRDFSWTRGVGYE